MFQTEMKEQSTGLCEIADLDGNVLDTLIHYAYTHELKFNDDFDQSEIDESLEQLWMAAEKYDMKKLRAACEVRMTEEVYADNAFRFLAFAREHEIKQLRMTAAKCIGDHPSSI
ncbi:uncharacterized protein LOC129582809 [Paramacrobiotus metropolitanus]|uniref:uncharacterized protein LOC129582809 n=1 Tax=Paramacrobiotus metropolitanus TaxID=2943436 RepID=UPI0024463A2B|nr:uncharacterized protein LOC129582809 [Paramacrobiotus metropolitanus]